ncbi:hypothetical protein BH09BAC1_BH09BAC1_19290 [soil metagenome]
MKCEVIIKKQKVNLKGLAQFHAFHVFKAALVLCLLLMLGQEASAQRNQMRYINRNLYFGISLGFNTQSFRVVHDQSFVYNDSIQSITSTRGPGFNLGIVSNLSMGKYFDLRFVPALVFGDKRLQYQQRDSTVGRTIESIILDFPLTVRFKSQPIRDVKFYVLAGMKYSLDLASNAKARRADDQVKVYRNDISVEYGMGIQIFFPLFIFSPEIKFSQGIMNLHARNPDLIYSSTIDKLFSRTLTFSLHFEG